MQQHSERLHRTCQSKNLWHQPRIGVSMKNKVRYEKVEQALVISAGILVLSAMLCVIVEMIIWLV
jgi:hypothetical protein